MTQSDVERTPPAPGSASSDPFFLSAVVALAGRLRAAHAGPGGLRWDRLTDAQKVPWIVKAYVALGGSLE